jgi:alanine racemase
MVDITGIPDAQMWDEVMLFGEDAYCRKDASAVAAIYGTIEHEVFTGIKEVRVTYL